MTTTTSPAGTLSAAAERLREAPDRPLDVPLAALLEKAAGDLDREVTEETPDCCEETHDKPGLYHFDGCGDWLTVYRGHGGLDGGCRCWDLALAVARAILGEVAR